jgi:hypothetical protein
MKEIELSKGLLAIVDDENYLYLSTFSWYAHPGNKTFYAVRCAPRDFNGKRERIYMHRVLMNLPRWNKGGLEVDHINHNGLDNRKENLIIATHSENALNSTRVYNKILPRPCQECETIFVPSHNKGKFCSPSCFGRFNMRQRSRKLGLR